MRKPKKSGDCVKCGIFRKSLHRDHVVPKCKGGTDDESNIQWLCANCHEDKTREDFTGFNLTPNRKPYSDETRAKISAGNKGKIITVEHRAKTSAALKGKPSTRGTGWKHTEEARAKINAAQIGVPKLNMRGRQFSEVHRQRLSIALTAYRVRKTEAELEHLKAQMLLPTKGR